jgi:tetratricopeptide (TPR) repeat protein
MQERFNGAAVSASRALAIAPELPSAHAALAAVSKARLDFAGALLEFRKATSAGGADASILGDYGRFLGQLGLTEEAYPIGRRVVAMDPLNGRSYSIENVALFYSRHFREVIPVSRKILALAPQAIPPLSSLGDAQVLLGNYTEAHAVYAQIPADDVFRLTGEGFLAERTGDHMGSSRALGAIERLFGGAAAFQIAQLHAQRGERDAAFAGLERAFRVRDPGMIVLLTDPFLDPIRGDARFKQLRSRINFPPGVPA